MEVIISMIKNVLVATDGSAHAKHASELGVELAKNSGGKVFALFIADKSRYFEPMGGVSYNIADKVVQGLKSEIQAEGENATKHVEEMAKKAGVPVEKKIIEGHPADDIMKFAEDIKASVIVVGSIGLRGIRKFQLGSVTEKVVHNSKVPVLVVY
jgi:nucleotide-binding universal stress UspA family protein